ncbi:MAG: peptidoglycan-binding domain-containing protein [Litoreibacter sp.]|nr:peptidoglycan-binding domain-containing protein [Litoreibacter sp.]
MKTPTVAVLASLALMACDTPQGYANQRLPTAKVTLLSEIPADQPQDRCWAELPRDEKRETVERFVVATPSQVDADGVELSPPVYRKISEEKVTRGPSRYFERVCAAKLTPRFIGGVQRALAARDLLEGQISETLDAPTKAAIKAFQSARGLPSDILSLEAASALGLVTIVKPTTSTG